MEKKYWIGRKRAAMAMARAATTAEARLIHYELAGRYSIRAEHSMPFMLPGAGPATQGERTALQLRATAPPAARATDGRDSPWPKKGRRGPSARGH
jgi:hypothetical protein